jgi:hypothetical protein
VCRQGKWRERCSRRCEALSAINRHNNQINQTLTEQTVPGLNRQASMGGALNSSRAGMAEAMANENAAIAMGNADSQIYNNAYNQGLNTAAQQRTAGLNTALSGNLGGLSTNGSLAQGQQNAQIGQNEFGISSQLGAANSGLSNQLGIR